MKVKVFDLMSRVIVKNTQISLVESKCLQNESLYNSKQKLYHDECWHQCEELDDQSSSKDDYIKNLSMCDCKCNKGWKIEKIFRY